MTLSAELQAGGIQLELLTGSLTGIYDPNGMGAMFFAVLAVAGRIERNYIREKTLEGQFIAASKGQGHPRPRDREEADHQGREERGQVPVGRLALPRPRGSRGHRGRRRPVPAAHARAHPPDRGDRHPRTAPVPTPPERRDAVDPPTTRGCRNPVTGPRIPVPVRDRPPRAALWGRAPAPASPPRCARSGRAGSGRVGRPGSGAAARRGPFTCPA
ncbi:hypothetical protein ACWFQ8_10295 [Streptomyces sp. NPDC055254]